MAKYDYDLLIIGGGSAGLTAARFAARLGRRVAIIEGRRLGGDCTWSGCVPSKTLLSVARAAHQLRQAHPQGPLAVAPSVEWPAVMDRVQGVVRRVYQSESPETLRGEGIDIHLASARFQDPHTVLTGEERLTAKKLLIATGAHPLVPGIPGLDTVNYLTYEKVWELTALPDRLLVVGGGPVGCELAQAFGRLGSRVTLLEGTDRLLPEGEPEASELVATVLTREGVDLRLNALVESVRPEAGGVVVNVSGGEVSGDRLLLSVGRQPRLAGLGLEGAGVAFNSRGIPVDRQLRTSQKHIFAAGDCLGGPQFTHYAGWQGFVAARNALLPGAARGVLDPVPGATFTDPEVARSGFTEAQARERFGDRVRVSHWPLGQVDRALIEGDQEGFIKLVHRSNGRLLGVTIVSPRAGEQVQEWVLAQERGLTLGDLSRTLHLYPTYAMGHWQLASQVVLDRSLSGLRGKVVRWLARWSG